ncbi:uncharacterized protein [Miscanthus floridulus]|uniref:uncharacterized protein n=1 Tax=Miscanthus floridulus TaxID=154761 RepID=UPI003457B5B4
MDTEAMPLPPPPPLRTRVAVAKRLPPHSSRKRPAEVPMLAPLKALKVNLGSTAHWVAEVQAALHHGTASARADPKEPTTQGGATEAALTQEGEAAPPPGDGKARGSDAAEVPLAVKTTGTEVPGVSQAGATEAAAPRTIETVAASTRALATAEAMMAEAGAPKNTEAMMVEAGAPGTTEATMAEARAPGTTDADVIVAGLPAQEVEMKAAEALVAPLVQGPPPLRESAREVEILLISSNDTSRAQEMAGTEVAGVVEQPVPTPGEGSSALTRVRPKPRGWNHPRVLWQSQDDPEAEPLFALEDVAEGGRWDTFEQYRQLAERSLRTALSVVGDDLPGVAQELETQSLGKSVFLRRERDVWDQLQRQKGLLAELGSEASRAAEASRVEAQRLKEKAEAFRVEARHWEVKAKESEAEVTRVAEASSAVQMVLETKIEEHEALKSAACAACEALVVEGVQSGSSLGCRLIALSGQADEVVMKLLEAAEGPGTALAMLFEEKVVPPPPSADARGPKP